MTLECVECETIRTRKRPPFVVPPLGTCNWRELSGFLGLVIQMSKGEWLLQAHLGGD